MVAKLVNTVRVIRNQHTLYMDDTNSPFRDACITARQAWIFASGRVFEVGFSSAIFALQLVKAHVNRVLHSAGDCLFTIKCLYYVPLDYIGFLNNEPQNGLSYYDLVALGISHNVS